MVFHLPLQFANMILQLPARPLERIVDGERQVGMPLVGLRGAVDIDFPAVRKRQTDIDLVETTFAVMTAGTFQHHSASRHATKTLLELSDVLGNRSLDVRLRIHALKINFDRRLHILTPMYVSAVQTARYIAISDSGLRSLLTSGISAELSYLAYIALSPLH
jgi:hypothetical protein